MSLVFAGVCSHAPGITGRADRADPAVREEFYANFFRMGRAIKESGADTLLVVAAEHFANFFMNNMPAYCVGMADYYEGPIEDEEWLGINRFRVNGNAGLSERLVNHVMNEVDVAYAQEWKFDHGIAVPLHFLTPDYDLDVIPININCQGPPLTPLHRAWKFGQALRAACDARARKDRAGRHRRRVSLAGNARFRKDQRGMGQGIPRPVRRQRQGRPAFLYRRRDL